MATDTASTGRFGRGVAAVIAALGLWLSATAAVIAFDAFANSRAAQDQDNYHLMAVRTFAAELPRADLRDYRSATTPGYHLALAEVSRFMSDEPRVLRACGAAFTLGMLGLLVVLGVRRAGGVSAGALVLPLACSLYVFSAGAWILPDNAGWLGVLAVLAIAMFRVPTAPLIFGAGVVLLLLVLCRQIHLWAAGVLWLWAFLGGPDENPEARTRVRRLGMALVASVPAFAAVGAFWQLWHGPVPPLFQGGVHDPVVGKTSPKNSGGNPATPAFLLMLFGAYGVFFLGFLREGLRRVRAGQTLAVAAVTVGMIAGLVVALVPETTFNADAGRYTGFWALVPRLPVVGGRSLFLAGGAAVGGAIVGLCLASLRRREALIVLAAVLGFMAAQSTAFAAWQRYMEPLVLIVLALVAIMASECAEDVPPERGVFGALGRWRALGPVALGLMLAAITVASLRAGSAGIG